MMQRIKSSRGQAGKRRNPEQGVAMIIALFTVLLLSILGASIVYSTQSEIWTNYNYRTGIQARYVADTGAERAADWIINNFATYYTAASIDMPDFTDAAKFDTTKYPMQCKIGVASSPCILSGISNIPSHFPDPGTLLASFNSATGFAVHSSTFSTMPGSASYSVALQLMSAIPDAATPPHWSLEWKIVSQGTAGGIRPATVQVMETLSTIVTQGTSGSSGPAFNYGLQATSTGCGAISINNSGNMYSYNSSTDPNGYSQSTSGVGVATPGGISLIGPLNGTIAAGSTTQGSTGSCTGTTSPSIGLETANWGSHATPTLYSGATTFPLVPDWSKISPLPPNTACSDQPVCRNTGSGGATWSPNPGTFGNVSLGNNATVVLKPGVYNFNSLSLQGGITLTISPVGSVTINVYGKDGSGNDLSTPISVGNGSISDAGIAPKNLEINYEGGANINLSASGGAKLYATIYAPNASLSLANNNAVYGAVIAKTTTLAGSATIVYDTTLGSGGNPGCTVNCSNSLATTTGYFDSYSWSRY